MSGGHGIGNLESGGSSSVFLLFLLFAGTRERAASLISIFVLSQDKIWVVKTFNAINEAYPHPENSLRNAAVGAVGSEYFVSSRFQLGDFELSLTRRLLSLSPLLGSLLGEPNQEGRSRYYLRGARVRHLRLFGPPKAKLIFFSSSSSINDLFAHESAVTMEDLLRGLLDLSQRPAVLVARTIGLEAEVSTAASLSLHLDASS